MAIPSGLSSQAGMKVESVVGTAVTVDRFYPLVSESMTQAIERLESKGIIAGARVLRSQQWAPGNSTVAGDINLELYDIATGQLLRFMFGALVTAGAGPYTHTATPGDMADDSYTWQIGKPDVLGTVHPFTFAGCMCTSWELSCAAGQIPTLRVGVTAMTASTGPPALASATFTSGIAPFTFIEGAVTIAGAAAAVKSITLSGDNGLDVNRRFLGSAAIAQPLEANWRTYGGTITLEFSGLTAYNRFVNGTESAMVLTFTSGAQILAITTNIRYDGTTPQVSGPGILELALPFKAVGASTDAGAITAVLTSSESAA